MPELTQAQTKIAALGAVFQTCIKAAHKFEFDA